MADNVIEILIKSAVQGNETVTAFIKQLGDLRKEGKLTEEQFLELQGSFKQGVAAGFSSEISKVTGELRGLREELVKTGKSTADIDKMLSMAGGLENTLKVSEAYKESLKAAEQFNTRGSVAATYRASTQAALEYGQAIQKTNAGTAQASVATDELAGHFSLLTGRQLGVNRVLGLAATALADLGPAGQIASNALLQVIYSGLRLGAQMALIGAAVGAVTTGIALLIKHLQEAKEKQEAFNLASRSANLSFFTNEIFKADTALIELGRRLDETNAKIAAQRAAGVRSDNFLESLRAGLEKETGTTTADRAKLVTEQQNILANRAQQAGLSIEFQTEAIGKNVREQQELSHESRIAAAMQGELKDATQQAKDAFIAQSAALRDKTTAEEVKKQTDAVKASMDSLIKSRADAAAASQQILYETTGNMAALQRSFGAARQGVIESTAADLKRQLEQNKLPELESGIRANAAERQRIALLTIQQQQERAMFQYREQARANEAAALASLENQARVTLEIEQSRLTTLREQGAPISQQDAQLSRVQDAEEALINATISKLEGQRNLLQLSTLQGNKLDEEKLKEQQISLELQKQINLLTQLNAKLETPAIQQDRKNRLIGIQQEIQTEQELEAARGARAVEVQNHEISLRRQALELQRQMDLAAASSPQQRQLLEINQQYERMREALEELVQKYPELAQAAETTLANINTANQQALANASNTTLQMLQSLSDAFVNSIDRAFDDLFDTTKSFGDKMLSFMQGLGQTVLKTILHNVITVPLKESLDATIAKIKQEMTGGSSLLGALGTVLTEGGATTATAATAANAPQVLAQAATNTSTAALSLGNAATALSSAATQLMEAAQQLAACCGGGQGGGTGLGGSLFGPGLGGIGGNLGARWAGMPELPGGAGGPEAWDQIASDISEPIIMGSEEALRSLEDMTQAVTRTGFSFDSLGLDTNMLSRGFDFLVRNLSEAASSVLDFISSLGSSGSSGGGGLGFLGMFGSLFSMGGSSGAGAAAMGRGGMVIPSGIMLPAYAGNNLTIPKAFMRPFQSGGTTRGPVLGVIGEEGPEIVARMKPARAMEEEKPKGTTTVIINGDITPKKPEMKPEDVIQIIENDGINGGRISKMTTTVIKRNR